MVTPAETVAAPVPAAPAAVASATPAATVPAAGAAVTAVVAQPGEAKGAAAPASGLLAEAPKTDASAPAKPAETKPVDWKLTAPEGVTLAAEDVGAIEAFAKENGLSQAQAEKVLARDVASRAAAETARQTQATTIGETWRAETEKHPEIGGAKLAEAVKNAQRTLAAYATPEERKAIIDTPYANNPVLIAILSRAAKNIPAEDVLHAGAATATNLNPARVMYPNSRH